MNTQTLKHLLAQTECKLRMAPWEWLYHFSKHKFQVSPDTCRQYRLTAKQIYGRERSPGISGYYRLYNEEDFLAASVESHLPFFDELILVHDSTTTDRTPEVARELAGKYPDKIRYFVYEPQAFKLRTREYRILPADHPNSFVNYYNFALSKTSRQIVVKVDGDQIAISGQFEKIINSVRDMDFMRDVYYTFSGINLWCFEGRILVDPASLAGEFGDHGFHIIRPEKTYYTKGTRTEDGYFMGKNRRWKRAGILFFHLKNMRVGIPWHSWRGPGDEEHRAGFRNRQIKARQRCVDWPTFVHRYRDVVFHRTTTDIAQLPDPEVWLRTLQIMPGGETVKP